MLENEKKILQNEYERCLAVVGDSDLHRMYADEKFTHSLQVFDAGNYLLKNENVFKNWSSKLIRLARTAVLFHDIGRFQEIRNLRNTPEQPNDHARFGYDFLRQYPEYNNPHILLPVKHHSNMIEQFYSDYEYNNIEDPHKKYEIEKIAFLVRDADKIANFKLLSQADDNIRRLFCPVGEDEIEMPSAPVLQDFFARKPIKRADVKTSGDRILCLLGWVFDLNYRSSFVYIQKFGGIDFLLDFLNKGKFDSVLKQKIALTVNNYMNERNQ